MKDVSKLLETESFVAIKVRFTTAVHYSMDLRLAACLAIPNREYSKELSKGAFKTESRNASGHQQLLTTVADDLACSSREVQASIRRNTQSCSAFFRMVTPPSPPKTIRALARRHQIGVLAFLGWPQWAILETAGL